MLDDKTYEEIYADPARAYGLMKKIMRCDEIDEIRRNVAKRNRIAEGRAEVVAIYPASDAFETQFREGVQDDNGGYHGRHDWNENNQLEQQASDTATDADDAGVAFYHVWQRQPFPSPEDAYAAEQARRIRAKFSPRDQRLLARLEQEVPAAEIMEEFGFEQTGAGRRAFQRYVMRLRDRANNLRDARKLTSARLAELERDKAYRATQKLNYELVKCGE